LRQDAFDTALAHHQDSADFPLSQNLDRSREPGIRLDALDLMTFGIENCTYRHCRLPEADRALERARSFVHLSLQSTVQRRFRCGRIRRARLPKAHSRAQAVPQHNEMMDE